MIAAWIIAALALISIGCAFDYQTRKHTKAIDDYRGREHWL